eukprot:746320-Hanusia_phi.AAC.1
MGNTEGGGRSRREEEEVVDGWRRAGVEVGLTAEQEEEEEAKSCLSVDEDAGKVLLPYNGVDNDFRFDRCFGQVSRPPAASQLTETSSSPADKDTARHLRGGQRLRAERAGRLQRQVETPLPPPPSSLLPPPRSFLPLILHPLLVLSSLLHSLSVLSLLAYGQTGAGKTFTMLGGREEETMGIIPRSINQILQTIDEMKDNG